MNVHTVYKQAQELADSSINLAEKLRSIALNNVAEHTSSNNFVLMITIFSLACIVGYYVVWRVTPLLHTPLMSITNAVSGIVIIGGMIATRGNNDFSALLGYLAVFLSAINIFGGFTVTQRMLEMFKKK